MCCGMRTQGGQCPKLQMTTAAAAAAAHLLQRASRARPCAQPKSGMGGTRGEGAQGGNQTKMQLQKRKGCPGGPEKTTKRATRSGTEGQQKENPKGGKAKGRGDGRRKATSVYINTYVKPKPPNHTSNIQCECFCFLGGKD